MSLPDIQKTLDNRNVEINHVGVCSVELPIRIRQRDNAEPQNTIAKFELAVGLGSHVKGTHMSRFTEVLMSYLDGAALSSERLQAMAYELAEKLETTRVHLRMETRYFLNQKAPVSGKAGLFPITGVVVINLEHREFLHPVINTYSGIKIVGKTCCPCSKEISDYDPAIQKGRGAHAQRSNVDILVRHHHEYPIYFEDLADVANAAYSSPIYTLLKRPDERAVTKGAYENPKFVEDVIRDVVVGLRKMPEVLDLEVRVQNEESIHLHDAYAEVKEIVRTEMQFGQAVRDDLGILVDTQSTD